MSDKAPLSPRSQAAPALRSPLHLLLARTALLLALLGGTAAAQIEVIELQHRGAEKLAPALTATATGGTVVKAVGSRLLVRGSPAAIKRLREVVQALDVPIRSLRISVRRASDTLAASAGAGAGVARNTVKTYGTRSAQKDHLLQTVTASAGRPAFIDTGESVPIIDRLAVLANNGVAYAERRRYQYRPEGFYATARLIDGHVIIDISVAHSNDVGEGKIQHRRIISTVSGRPGEWIPLGVIREAAMRGHLGVVYTTRSAGSHGERVEIRVEVLE